MQDLMNVESSLPALRDPREIVEEARGRANMLMTIVKEQRLSKRLGQKDHIQIEAWQTVAAFYNCSAGSDEAESVEIDGIKGAKAHARVTDLRTGLVVSEAISFCMRDEPNWKGKPWFQIASMAQTRAMSKALANRFRWVAVLAGFSGTPAEEMEHHENRDRRTPLTILADSEAKEQETELAQQLKASLKKPEDGASPKTGPGSIPAGDDHQQSCDAPAHLSPIESQILDYQTQLKDATTQGEREAIWEVIVRDGNLSGKQRAALYKLVKKA